MLVFSSSTDLYFPIHPELIKRILVTDFDYFIDRGMYGNAQKLPLSWHIFSMEGEEWKKIRSRISPTFTSQKLKTMYGDMVRNCQNLIETLLPFGNSNKVIDIREVLLRFTSDVIGSTSFGIECNSLKYPESEFVNMVNKISNHSNWKLLRLAFEEGLKNPGNIEKIAYNDKVVEDFFTNLVKETVKYRDVNKIVRNDFLNVLIQVRDTYELEIQEIVAQSYLFFIAGFKTSAFTLCFCLHELAQNQHIQDDIRNDIWEKLGKDSSKYNFDDIFKLQSLDQVIKGEYKVFL